MAYSYQRLDFGFFFFLGRRGAAGAGDKGKFEETILLPFTIRSSLCMFTFVLDAFIKIYMRVNLFAIFHL